MYAPCILGGQILWHMGQKFEEESSFSYLGRLGPEPLNVSVGIKVTQWMLGIPFSKFVPSKV